MWFRKILKLSACAVVVASLTNCAGWQQRIARLDRDASSEACIAAGYTNFHPQHEECITNTTAARKAQAQREAQQTIFAGLLLGLAVKGAPAGAVATTPLQPSPPASTPYPSYTAPIRSTTTAPIRSTTDNQGSTALTARSGIGSQASRRICPDGSYVFGTECRIAPDGTYVAGSPQIAPDGTYVTGRPQIAPDGTYVGGNGPVRICPDGSYVSGSSCIVTPNGSYVGAP
jgi:hypothetical protein